MWFKKKGTLTPPEDLLVQLKVDTTGYSDIDRYKDFKATFATPAGKRVLHQLLRWSHIWQSSMAEDALTMAFSEGERNLGLKILATLSYEPQEKAGKQTTKHRREQ